MSRLISNDVLPLRFRKYRYYYVIQSYDPEIGDWEDLFSNDNKQMAKKMAEKEQLINANVVRVVKRKELLK